VTLRPVLVHEDGSIDAVYDETGHSGTVAAAQVVWTSDTSGTGNHAYIVLPCPDGCGAVAIHPVGGGAAPLNVQQMFVEKTTREGCACGQVAAGRTDGVPESHARLNCNRMDGPGRWQLDVALGRSTYSLPDLSAQPLNFQVVYQDSDGLIVGLEPAGGVGPDLAVAVFHEVAEYEVLVRTDPAYVSADKQHIVSTPQAAA
jgi:hypothetical protein